MQPARRVELGRIPAHHAATRPRSLAIGGAQGHIDFGTLGRRVNRIANALTRAGLRAGDRVALRLPNSHRHFECLFACAKLAAVLVPIDAAASPDDVEHVVRDSSAAVLLDGEDAYDSFAAEAPETEPGSRATADDPLLIMYTSGTTGQPKGIVLTHANVLYTSFNQLIGWQLTASDRVLVVAPFHHVGGLLALGFPCLHAGGAVLLAPAEPDAILEAIARERITALFLPPRLWSRLARAGSLGNADVTSVRLCASGGDPIPLQILEPLIDRFQAEFTDAYGLTEAASCSTLLHGADVVRRHGSAGKALVHNLVRVANPDGSEATPGEIGEIVQAGPTIMQGYWRRPVETAAAIRDGWLWTGDLGRIDHEGFIHVLGRGVDVITTGGAKVHPSEIERVLREHAAVEEAAVIGIPDVRLGEAVAACVVPRAGTAPTPADIVAFCAGKLADYQRPAKIFICSTLPRNAGGKVIKAKLRVVYGTPL